MKALLVPGQGKIHPGIVERNSPEKRRWFSCAEDCLGRALTLEAMQSHDAYCAAIIANALALYERFRNAGGSADVTAGYSVGQFGALAIAGALSFEDSIRGAIGRARIMQAHLVADCGMLSLIGLDASAVDRIVETVNADAADGLDRIYVSNMNSRFNFTIAGRKHRLAQSKALAEAAGCKSASILDVEGAWHSPYQLGAQPAFAELVDSLDVRRPSITFICNVTGSEIQDPAGIKEQLVAHLTSAVQWRATVETLKAMGVTAYLECGAGDQLSKMLSFMRVGPTLSLDRAEDSSTCAGL